MFAARYFGPSYFGDAYFGIESNIAPPAPPADLRDIGGSRRPSAKRHPRYAKYKVHPEEIARQQRMVQQYLDSLEEKPKAPVGKPKKAPKFTAALARAAADVQLTQVVRAAAAVRDRALAAEELRRRRLKLVLLLALD